MRQSHNFLLIELLVVMAGILLLPGCHKKIEANVSARQPEQLIAWGASKDEALGQLSKVNASVISNAQDFIIAEIGPQGLTSTDGKPAAGPIRVELHFTDGKLDHIKTGP